MAAMRSVGYRHQLPPHAHVHETETEYVIELDVSDFMKTEVAVEVLGPRITVRGDQLETPGDEGRAFRIHERLEESFRLPDDADPDDIHAYFKHGVLELRVKRLCLTPRRLRIERRRSGLLLNPDAEGV